MVNKPLSAGVHLLQRKKNIKQEKVTESWKEPDCGSGTGSGQLKGGLRRWWDPSPALFPLCTRTVAKPESSLSDQN